jgi:hypothetical protein
MNPDRCYAEDCPNLAGGVVCLVCQRPVCKRHRSEGPIESREAPIPLAPGDIACHACVVNGLRPV